ncbi:MAG TPA: hypothetical protein DCE42_23440 [Myxococcales bacterium]|nr:hypothetical protein [Myxococcales bacterium]
MFGWRIVFILCFGLLIPTANASQALSTAQCQKACINPSLFPTTSSIQLPLSAQAYRMVQFKTSLSVSPSGIYVDGVKQISLRSGWKLPKKTLRRTGSYLILPLYKRLLARYKRRKALAKRTKHPTHNDLLLFFNQDLPYGLLTKLLYTGGQAGFGEFDLAVCHPFKKGTRCEARIFLLCPPMIGGLPPANSRCGTFARAQPKTPTLRIEKAPQLDTLTGALKGNKQLAKWMGFKSLKKTTSSRTTNKRPAKTQKVPPTKRRKVSRRKVTPRKEQRPLNLTIHIKPKGISLLVYGHPIPTHCSPGKASPKPPPALTFPNKQNKMDLAGLTTCLKKIKKASPRESRAIIVANRNIKYKNVIQVLDLTNTKHKGKRLFPYVVFSATSE